MEQEKNLTILSEKMTYTANIFLLGTHGLLLLLFAHLQVTFMFYLNIFSVTLYVLLFPMIKKNILLYLKIVYFEILVHMVCATICMGWEYGYQLYCFSLIPICYYVDYVSRKLRNYHTHPLRISFFIVLCFLFSRYFTTNYGALYPQTASSLANGFYTANAFLVFLFLTTYMKTFEEVTLYTERQLVENAEFDELTKLANRYHMNGILSLLQTQKAELAFAIVDIDDFKQVNDRFGHYAGDCVLSGIAQKLHSIEGDHTYVCRWGGEEFLVVQSGPGAFYTLQKTMERLRQQIDQETYTYKTDALSVTISVGVTPLLEGEDYEQAVERADQNLYTVKNSGKNRVLAQ